MGLMIVSALLSGCSAGRVSPGATLLSALKNYEGEIQMIGGSSARWPERQRLGSGLKALVAGTVGPSVEFFRLIDYDIKRHEYAIAFRELNLRPERAREMKEELAAMSEELPVLKQLVRGQLARLTLQAQEDAVESAAILGLLSLALDGFAAPGPTRGADAPSTKVNQYLVTDLGLFATVRAADGKMFRCVLFGGSDDSAGMRCEPVK